jgi:predicted DNA-binding transcriptional regulator AlpA
MNDHDRLIDRQELQRLAKMSRASVFRKLKDGTLPAGFQLWDGPTAPRRWRLSEIRAWIESREQIQQAAGGEHE